MIRIAEEVDCSEIKRVCGAAGVSYSENVYMLAMTENGSRAGYCLIGISERKAVIEAFAPQSDISLADGILRASCRFAVDRGCVAVHYGDGISETTLAELGIIADKKARLLAVDFNSCGHADNGR